MGQRVGHRTRRDEDSGQQEKVGGGSRVRGTRVCEEEGMGEAMGHGGRRARSRETVPSPKCDAHVNFLAQLKSLRLAPQPNHARHLEAWFRGLFSHKHGGSDAQKS